MILDTSAIIAILWNESEREHFLDAITHSPLRLMSAVSAYEAAVVVYGLRKNKDDVEALWELLATLRVEIVPFGLEDAAASAAAYQRFGKGIHRAGLNLCDCPAYSLAKTRSQPLLFQGDDFSRTDVAKAG